MTSGSVGESTALNLATQLNNNVLFHYAIQEQKLFCSEHGNTEYYLIGSLQLSGGVLISGVQ